MNRSIYSVGELVRHPKKLEWGVGKISQVETNGRITVWFTIAGEKVLHTDKIAFSLERMSSDRDSVIEYHRDYMTLIEKPYSGVDYPNAPRKRRSTHCYNCKSSLDSDRDIECNACKWMVCRCGACGCGYHGR